MGKYFLLLIILSPSIGQILPTVPRNVFRLTLEDYSADSEWDLKDQEFDLRAIGKAYYDHTTKNDTAYFSASLQETSFSRSILESFAIQVKLVCESCIVPSSFFKNRDLAFSILREPLFLQLIVRSIRVTKLVRVCKGHRVGP